MENHVDSYRAYAPHTQIYKTHNPKQITENPMTLYDTITALAKRRGLYWPSFEIYGGQSGFVTYGDPGSKLKRNIEDQWRTHFTNRQEILEIDAPLINPAIVFEASGHIDNFKEHSTTCTKCNRSYRADHLIEEKTGLENIEAQGGKVIHRLLREHKIKCPRCGGPLADPTLILTMFKTEIGAVNGETGYGRPETAQGMFTNFRRAHLHAREKLPFAIAQTGKVLRNEISPRRGMTRLREFTIIELELFFDPENPDCPYMDEVADLPVKLITEKMLEEGNSTPIEATIAQALEDGHILAPWLAYFMGVSQRFINSLGVPPEKQRFRAHLPDERAHYSVQTYDHEAKLEWGWLEVAGHAYRTDYDLKAHRDAQEPTVLRQDGTRYVPHVVEPSFGLDRLFYVTLEHAYLRRGKRTILQIPRTLAPTQIQVNPLITRDGLPETAREIHQTLRHYGYATTYDESGSIGRRYARADEIGTPLSITIDYDTKDDQAITIRDRDTWAQVRTPIKDLSDKLQGYFKGQLEILDLGEKIERD
jgi:glycyl-tRNA synthetase